MSSEQFNNMAFYYSVTEFATALKPSVMKFLFTKGSKKVVYLDPDIMVYEKLEELDNALDKNSIVLTPHTLSPIPRDDLRPSETDILGSGTFNLGFLGLSKSRLTDDFLNWWEERLQFDSLSDPQEMLFTDQRWIDFVPSYFPYFKLSHPGYNVAYWNLHERILSQKLGQYFVNDQPLKFFHFSGFRPDKPWILSKYVSDKPRITVSGNVVLAKICNEYAKKSELNGWTLETSIQYGFSNFENGKKIPSSLRRLYREDCISASKQGDVMVPPRDWQQWATQKSYDSGNISRILLSVWKSRPDLKNRFPDATGKDAQEFLNWARKHGVAEGVIDNDFIDIGPLANENRPIKKTTKKGVNFAGYLTGVLGVGQSARLIRNALDVIDVPVTYINSKRVKSEHEESYELGIQEILYPLTIAVVNADHFRLWVSDFGPEFLANSSVIGVWAWETEDFNKNMHEAFKYVNEIWAVSSFVKKALEKHTKKPIYVLPNPIIPPNEVEILDRNNISLAKESKYNLFIFDYLSCFNRKNPIGLIEAHMRAFPNEDGPLLIIKSINGEHDAENREKLRYLVHQRSDIKLIEDYMTRNQLIALINECESYISLHRSEGYGLTMAEAMSLGKPVIATAYSGNLDFMNEKISLLVPYKLVKVGEQSYPYDPDSSWAEPDLQTASIYMKKLFTHPEIAHKLGKSAKEFTSKNFSMEIATDFIQQRILNYFSTTNRIKRKMNYIKILIRKRLKALVTRTIKIINQL